MSPAYAVTTGEYSDYRVDSVWTTKEAAEARRAVLHTDRYPDVNPVEEYPLDDAVVASEVRCWQAYAQILADTGEVTTHYTVGTVAALGPDGVKVTLQVNPWPNSGPRRAVLTVDAMTEERANKVMSERLAHIKAQIDTTGPLEDTP